MTKHQLIKLKEEMDEKLSKNDTKKLKPEESKEEEKEDLKEISPEIRKKIINFIKSNEYLDDTKFHKYVMSLGLDPHEAEECVYDYVRKH